MRGVRGGYERPIERYPIPLRSGLVSMTALVLIVFPLVNSAALNLQMSLALVYAVAVLGLNLLIGQCGQLSLGNTFFFAVGAYTYAALTMDAHVPYLLTVPVAFVLCFAGAVVFGIPALRLEGLYLGLVSLGLALITPNLVQKFSGLTRGSNGFLVDQPSAPAWTGLGDDQWQYFVVLAFGALLVFFSRNLVRSSAGAALGAIRHNEVVAKALGVNIARVKVLTFAVSAGFAGVGGALFTMVVGIAAPGSFDLTLAIAFLVALVVGGSTSVFGALIGGLFIEFVPVYTSDLNQSYATVIYGVILIAAMFAMPTGVIGIGRIVVDALMRGTRSDRPQSAKVALPADDGHPVDVAPSVPAHPPAHR